MEIVIKGDINNMKTIFRDEIMSYMIVLILGILAGISVVFFSGLSGEGLWAFSYWSSETFGFWMFSTSIIVLTSNKRKTAIINAIIYIFIMFFITGIYKSVRDFSDGISPYASMRIMIEENVIDWIIYGIEGASICGVLAAILWCGKKYTSIWEKILCILPLLFIMIEGVFLFVIVFRERTKLFSAIVDVICFSLYGIFILKSDKEKCGVQEDYQEN